MRLTTLPLSPITGVAEVCCARTIRSERATVAGRAACAGAADIRHTSASVTRVNFLQGMVYYREGNLREAEPFLRSVLKLRLIE